MLQPPTVQGPVSTASQTVTVLGVRLGTRVILLANGHVAGEVPTAGLGQPLGLYDGYTAVSVQVVIGLNAGDVLTATQSADGVTSAPSAPGVTVIGVPDQLGAPDVVEYPYAGAETLVLSRLFPGGKVTVGVNRGGVTARMDSEVSDFTQTVLTSSPLQVADQLSVTQTIGGASATWTAPGTVLAWSGSLEAHLPAPVFELAPQACDRGIRLGRIVPGATVVWQLNGVQRRRLSAGHRIQLPVDSLITSGVPDTPLNVGDELVIWQEFPATGQRTDPAAPLTATIAAGAVRGVWIPSVLCPQTPELLVFDARPGALVRIYVREPGQNAFVIRDELTHRASLDTPDRVPLTINLPLQSEVTATQEACAGQESPQCPSTTVSAPSDPSPPEIAAPVLQCSGGVLARNLGYNVAVSICSAMLGGPVTPTKQPTSSTPLWFDCLTLAGDKLFITQTGCVPDKFRQSPEVPVTPANSNKPTLDYVFIGDQTARVICTANLTPGAVVPAAGAGVEVFLERNGQTHWVGTGTAGSAGTADVALGGWQVEGGDRLSATCRLCGDPVGSDSVPALPARAPRPPVLTAPAPGTTTAEHHPAFRWTDPDAATPYAALSFYFQIVDDQQPNNRIRGQDTPDPSYSWTGDPTLADGHNYRWFVTSVGRRGSATATADLKVTASQPPPPPPPPPPPVRGFSQVMIYNCDDSGIEEYRTVEIWISDLTTGAGFQDNGPLTNGYLEGARSSAGPVHRPPRPFHWRIVTTTYS